VLNNEGEKMNKTTKDLLDYYKLRLRIKERDVKILTGRIKELEEVSR